MRASIGYALVFLWSCVTEAGAPQSDPRTPEEATRRLFDEERREGLHRCACHRAALGADAHGPDDARLDDPCVARVERLTRECVVAIYAELFAAFPEAAYCQFDRARRSRACVEATGCDEAAFEACADDWGCPFVCEGMTGEALVACEERVAAAELAAAHCE